MLTVDAFGETRLWQIRRLLRIHEDHQDDLADHGRQIIYKAVFTMILDCMEMGMDRDVIEAAIRGDD